MADRRIHRAKAKLAKEPPPITGVERNALKAIDNGLPSKATLRKRLVSKGLITSEVGRLAYLTPLGRKALAEKAPEPPAIVDRGRDEARYLAWAKKHGVKVRQGAWG